MDREHVYVDLEFNFRPPVPMDSAGSANNIRDWRATRSTIGGTVTEDVTAQTATDGKGIMFVI